MNSQRKKIFFSFPAYTSFVQKDELLMKKHFAVKSFKFDQRKLVLPFSFIKQLIVLLFRFRSINAYVSFFAGYSSFLPGLFSKLSGSPHIIILGGADCCSFPIINYGNFRKKILGFITCKTIKMATHLVPVHESLIYTKYTYLKTNSLYQGYKHFCPTANAPCTVINTTYDPDVFYRVMPKVPNSFITVGQMNEVNYYRKGIDLIFEMANRFPNCHFTVVGSSKNMVYPPIPKNLEIIPTVPNQKLKFILSKYEFYMQLSIQEGLPNALCEAMLCECIPIGTNVAGIPFCIGPTGFILDTKDENILEKIIREALNSDKATLSKMARQRIIEQFPLNKRDELISLINSVVEN